MAPSLLLSSSAPTRLYLTISPGAPVPHFSVTPSPLASSFRPLSASAFRTSRRRNFRSHARSFAIRCEQGAKENNAGLGVWLARGAMLGFVGAITVELTTGKGVLENLGLMAPLPTVALALTGVVGAVTAFLVFQSGSQD